MEYKPVITLTERDGKKAIWINMPDGDNYNIWDLKNVDLETLKAIAAAFELGREAAQLVMHEVFSTTTNVEIKM